MRRVALCLLYIRFSLLLNAGELRFENIGIQQGLSHSLVYKALQDQKGYMWFATEDGLNKYDGYNFTIYRPEPGNPNSILGSSVSILTTDKLGNIWMAFLSGGVSCIKLNENKILNFSSNDKIKGNQINCLLADSKGQIWVGTNEALNVIDVTTGSVQYFQHEEGNVNAISNNYINTVYEDSRGDIWVGTQLGVNKFDRATSRFYSSLVFTNKSDIYIDFVKANTVRSIYEDSYGELWVGTQSYGLNKLTNKQERKGFSSNLLFTNFLRENYLGQPEASSVLTIQEFNGTLWVGYTFGLAVLNAANRGHFQFKKFFNTPQFLNNQNACDITVIVPDSKKNVWVASYNSGVIDLNCFNATAQKYTVYKPAITGFNSISDRHIFNVFEDRSGILWICTSKSGLYKCNLYAKEFKTLNTSNGLNNNDVYSIYQSPDQTLYVGTAKGLNVCYAKTASIKHYEYTQKCNNCPKGLIVGVIMPNTDGTLWIGYLDNQLSKFNPRSGIFNHYQYCFTCSNSIVSWSIRSIVNDSSNTIWLGSYTAGLTHMLQNGKEYINYTPGKLSWSNAKYIFSSQNALNDIAVQCLYLDKNEMLWIGTQRGGLNVLNIRKGTFKHYSHSEKDPNSISSNEIRCIFKDSDNQLWIGTSNGGLNLMNERSETFSFYTKKNGLLGNTIYGILEDKSKQLWLSTNKGLSVLNKKTSTISNYTVDDGLQSNEFNPGAFFKNHLGQMFFGGVNGLNYFFPDSIISNPFMSKATLVGLKIFNKYVTVGDTVNGYVILNKSIEYCNEIILHYNQNDFVLEFSSMHFVCPQKVKYAYKLGNYDASWKYTDAQHRMAGYTNLSPGEYSFQLKATNNDGIWNDQPQLLTIIVLPPWWRTWWFSTSIIIAIITFILTFIRLRTIRLLKHKALLERIVRERTSELLEKQEEIIQQKEVLMLQAEKLKETDSLKSRFFANISHELRTPLTLIISPIESLLNDTFIKTNVAVDNKLNIIYKNSTKLLLLINQLLEVGKVESNTLKLKIERINLVDFMTDMAKLFSGLCEQLEIKIAVQHEDNEYVIWADTDCLEKITFNLLSNAFKFTPKGGNISVLLQKSIAKLNNDGLYTVVSVIDTGIGISPQALPHIFNRFYQVSREQAKMQEGTGIGLSLVKDLVDLHKGHVEVESQINSGTSFKVYFLEGNEHFNPSLIVDNVSYETNNENITRNISSLKQFKLPHYYKPYITDNDKPVLLAIDDNADILQYINNELYAYYTVHIATNGQEGLNLAFSIIPDIIVCDVMMPKLAGTDVCKQLKVDEKTSHIPVILLTAKTEEESLFLGFESGADDYISKPFNIEILKVRIKNLIESRKALKQQYARKMFLEPRELSVNSFDEQFLNKINDCIEQNISNTQFSVETLSDTIGMSRIQVHRKFHALTGVTPGKYITDYRIKRAAQLLRKKAGNVSEVMFEVGFESRSAFAKRFRELFGVNPSEYSQ